MTGTLIAFDETAEGWERALYAFLAEKERRSGSRRTVEGYSRMLQHFFGTVGKPPDRVTSQEVFAWTYGKGLSGRELSPDTIALKRASRSASLLISQEEAERLDSSNGGDGGELNSPSRGRTS
jgi:hypothetical protein